MLAVPDGWPLTWFMGAGQGVEVAGSDDAGVPVIERGDRGQAEAFGDRYQPGVNAAEVLVSVLVGQLGDASPVTGGEVLDEQLTVGYRSVERGLGGGTELAVDQPASLRQHQLGGHQRTWMGLE